MSDKKLELHCGPRAWDFNLKINGQVFRPTEFAIDFNAPDRGGVKITIGFFVRETDILIENGEFSIKPQAFPGLTLEQLIYFRDSCDKTIRDKYESRIEFAKKYPNGLPQDDDEPEKDHSDQSVHFQRGPKLL